MRVHVAVLAKDESDRYLSSALEVWSEISDTILFLDDLSCDNTKELSLSFDKVRDISPPGRRGGGAWGDETPFRKALFNYAITFAEIGDIVFWLDCDMIPLKDPRPFFEETCFDSFFFVLYDLWNIEQVYQFRNEPPFWIGHKSPRLWAIRVTEEIKERKKDVVLGYYVQRSGNVTDKEIVVSTPDFEWSGRGIHCGHVPSSLEVKNRCMLPPDFGILHYGYATCADREDRDARYRSVSHQLTEFEREHAETILTEPRLEILPFECYPSWRLERKTERRIYP